MNKKEIEELIKFVSKAGVSEVSLETKDIKITIKNSQRAGESMQLPQAPVVIAAPAAIPLAATAAVRQEGAPATSTPAASDESKYHVVKSPMIGTFYRSPNPEKPNFVSVGDEVKQGQVICIIEAMKLFNEIESDVSGKIVKVLVDNATPVEYDQPLFLIDPS
jgi:acetyl-CoA carboxylase biotin carboxyl carrier protein